MVKVTTEPQTFAVNSTKTRTQAHHKSSRTIPSISKHLQYRDPSPPLKPTDIPPKNPIHNPINRNQNLIPPTHRPRHVRPTPHDPRQIAPQPAPLAALPQRIPVPNVRQRSQVLVAKRRPRGYRRPGGRRVERFGEPQRLLGRDLRSGGVRCRGDGGAVTESEDGRVGCGLRICGRVCGGGGGGLRDKLDAKVRVGYDGASFRVFLNFPFRCLWGGGIG
jgi:hypothetical protein